MKPLEIEKQKQLARLSKAVNGHHEAVSGIVKSVTSKSLEALTEAILCGKALTEAKAICGRGQFYEWSKNATGVAFRTTQRYMRVYRLNCAGKLDGACGLRQAYQLPQSFNADDKPAIEVVSVSGC